MCRSRSMLILVVPLAPILAKSLLAIVLASSSVLAGCTDECANDCERNDWPRVIVGIDCEDDGSPVAVAGVDSPGGSERDGDRNGCPVELDGSGYACSVTFTTTPSVKSLELRARRDDVEASTVLPLREFNYCGREIAYIELFCAGEDMRFGDPEYISPCSQ